MVRARARHVGLAAPLMVAALAGCGAPDPVTVAGPTLDLRLSEYRIAPPAVVVRRRRVEIRARNTGILTHNVVLERAGRRVRVVPTLQPGRAARVSVTLARGSYRMYCSIGNHDDLGMYGTLTVR